MRAVVLAALVSGALALEPGAPALPFAPGERLTYQARVGKLGNVGRAAMTIGGPVALRGRQAYHLRFEIDTRVGFVRVLNVSESWIDPAPAAGGALASLRFQKREQHPLARREEAVELFPEEQRWERSDGGTGRTMSESPLDELSFIYFLRTVPLEPGGALRFDRHFEAARNPTLVKVVGRELLRTPAGAFNTLVVEMQVRDDRMKGGAAIRLHLSDDARRLPVRIETSVPVAGKAVLTLESWVPAPGPTRELSAAGGGR